jgi:hypothetical protein
MRNYNVQKGDYQPGQIVSVIQFDKGKPAVRSEVAGTKNHPSYEAVLLGKPIGVLTEKVMISDFFKDFFATEGTQPASFTRKVQTKMPEFKYGEGSSVIQGRPLTEVNFMPSEIKSNRIEDIAAKVGGGNVSGGAKRFGAFMQEMKDKDITVRDVIKSYGITLSSIQRGEQAVDTVKRRWPDAPFETGSKVRPEDAFAALLGTADGKRYLDAAEQGKFDSAAAEKMIEKFATFGLQNKLLVSLKDAAEKFYPKAEEIISLILSFGT